MTASADRHLLFGMLALQNGLINQGQLVAAFQAWTLEKPRSLADHLQARGDLDADDRTAVEALVARHLKRHGGDVEKSLAAVPAGKSTQASLARIGDPDIEATLNHVASEHRSTRDEDDDPDRTGSISVGAATSEGQRFRVLRPHARGGLGAVFVALDAELNREVALKQILDHHADDPTSRQRFLIEAEITGGLEHPGIVPVYGLGTYGTGRPYYAMRFIKGESLKEAIELFHAEEAGKGGQGQRSLELRRLLGRFTDVCNAIDYAHSRGVLHRDIKPANIIVGKFGETLVVDWGLAKPLGRFEPAQRPRRADAGAELGQRQRRHPTRVGDGDPGLHEPRAGPRRARPARPSLRCLQPRCHPLLPLDRQARIRRRRRRGGLAPCNEATSRLPASSIRRSTGRSRRSASRRCRNARRIATIRARPWPMTSSAGWPTNRSPPGRSHGTGSWCVG